MVLRVSVAFGETGAILCRAVFEYQIDIALILRRCRIEGIVPPGISLDGISIGEDLGVARLNQPAQIEIIVFVFYPAFARIHHVTPLIQQRRARRQGSGARVPAIRSA